MVARRFLWLLVILGLFVAPAIEAADREIQVLVMAPGYQKDWALGKDRDSIAANFDFILEPQTWDQTLQELAKVGRGGRIRRAVFLGHGYQTDGKGGIIDFGQDVNAATLLTYRTRAYNRGDASVLDAFAPDAEVIYYNCHAGQDPKFLQESANLFLAFSGGTVYGSDDYVTSDVSAVNKVLYCLSWLPFVEVNFKSPSKVDYRKFNQATLPRFIWRETEKLPCSVKGPTQVKPLTRVTLEAVLPKEYARPGLEPHIRCWWFEELGPNKRVRLAQGPRLTVEMGKTGKRSFTLEVRLDNDIGARLLASVPHSIEVVPQVETPTPSPTATPTPEAPVLKPTVVSPPEVLQTDEFELQVKLPAGMSAARYDWIRKGYEGSHSVEYDVASTSEPRLKYQLGWNESRAFQVKLYDAAGKYLDTSETTVVKVLAPRFGLTLYGAGWTGGENKEKTGLSYRRPESMRVDEKLSEGEGFAHATGSAGNAYFSVRWMDSEELRDKVEGTQMVAGFRGNGTRFVKGKYGFIVDSKAEAYFWTNTGGPAGSRLAEQLRNKHFPLIEARRKATQKDLDAMLASLTITAVPEERKAPGHPDEVEQPPKATVKLSSDRLKLGLGETANLEVKVENAGSGLTYAWSGPVEGRGARVVARPTSAGKVSVSVEVRDASGLVGTGSLELEVEGVRVELVSAPPPTMMLGAELDLEAKVTPATPGSVLRWQSTPELSIPEGARSKVGLTAPGRFLIKAVLLDSKTGMVLGESSPIDLEVQDVPLRIAFEPVKARVGQPLQARVAGSAVPREARFLWNLPNELRQTEGGQTASITVMPLQEGSFTVKVLAVTTVAGEVLAQAETTLKVTLDSVRVESLDPLKAGQDIRLKATFAQPASYRWAVEGGQLVGPGDQAQVTVQSPGGTCTARVEALVEGQVVARGSLAMAISGTAKVADPLEGKVRALVEQGKHEEALALVEAAPSRPASLTTWLVGECKKLAWEVLGRSPEPEIDRAIRLLEPCVRLAPTDQDAAAKLAQARQARESYRRMLSLRETLRAQLKALKVITAYETLKAMSDSQQGLRGSPGIFLEANKEYDVALKAMNAWVTEHQSAWSRCFQQRNWAEAVRVLEEALGSWELTLSTDRDFKSSLAMARANLAEQEAAWKTYQEVKAAWEAGQLAQPYQHAGKIRPDLMPVGDARIPEMQALLAALQQNRQPVAPLNPAPPSGSVMKTRRPEVGVTFTAPVRPETVRLTLDGRDVTRESKVSNEQVRYQPLTDLSEGSHTAGVRATGADGRAIEQGWTFSVTGPATVAPTCNVAPVAGSTASSRRPEVGATFLQPMQTQTIRLVLDGQDVTAQSRVSNEQVRYQPASDLPDGTHQARLTAVADNGQSLDRSWSFSVAGPATPPPGAAGCNVAPPVGATASSRRPEVGATFLQPMQPQTIRLVLDGADVTGQSRVTNEQIRYQPSTDLSDGAHNAHLTAVADNGQRVERSWSFVISGPAAPPPTAASCNVAPASGATASSRRPEVGATFLQPMRPQSIRLLVDGQDVTGQSRVTNEQVRYQPPSDLRDGAHYVQLVGVAADGQSLERNWSFTVAGPAAPPPTAAGCNVAPPSGSTASSRRPEVGATFLQPMQPATIRLALDGREVTGQSRVTSDQVRYQPGTDLAPGTHQASLVGLTTGGQRVERSWSFAVVGPVVTTPPPTPPTTPPTTPTTPTQPPAGTQVTALLENRDSDNIHIFVQGSDNFGPHNRLTPGERRQVSIRVPSNGRVTFVAGRNGQVLSTRHWDTDPDDRSRYPHVTYTRQGLVVTTGLR